MKNTPPQPADRRVNELDILFMLSIVLGVGASFVWLPQNITVTIMLLLGIWSIDVYLKRLVGIGISTAFADLSFASLVFVASRGVSLIHEESLTQYDSIYLMNIILISFILGGYLVIQCVAECNY